MSLPFMLVLVAMVAEPYAQAQAPAPEPAVDPSGLPFWVLPGAESGGAHQAGILVALIGHERARAVGGERVPQVGGVSGTSTGALNAVMAALQLCAARGDTYEPENNLLWGAWRDLSWDALSPGDRTCREYARENPQRQVECSSHDPDAYGPRDGLWTANAFAGVRHALTELAADTSPLGPTQRWSRDCKVLLGITLGAERPEQLLLGKDEMAAELPTSRRFTMVSLQFSADDGQGGRRNAFRVCDAPRVDTQTAAAPPATRLQLPFVDAEVANRRWDPELASVAYGRGEADACHQISLDAFLDLLTASMAVPLAFAPQAVPYCGTGCQRLERAGLYCPQGTTLCSGRFMDGSRFDGQPISAAVAMSYAPGNIRSNEYIVAGQARPEIKVPVPTSARGSAYYLDYAGGFVDTASKYERLMLLRYGAIQPPYDKLSFIESSHPLVADLPIFDRGESMLGLTFPGFTAFLHPNFRLFDYYLGIAEGLLWLARRECRLTTGKEENGCLLEQLSVLRTEVKADVSPGLSRILDLRYASLQSPRSLAANSTNEEQERAEELALIWKALEFRQDVEGGEALVDDPFRRFVDGLRVPRAGADPYLGLGFADDLEYWRFDQLRQLFHRLVALENEDDSPVTTAVAASGRFYAAQKATEYRSGVSLGLGSIPKDAGPLGAAVQLALPYRVQGDIRSGDLDLGWNPLAASGAWSSLHASAGLTGHWYNFLPSGPKWSWGPTVDLWGTLHNRGFLLHLWPPLVNLIPEAGVRGTFFLGPYRDDAMGPQVSGGVFIRLLTHVELEVGWSPFRGQFAKVGLTDVNGLMYWLLLGARGSDSRYAEAEGAPRR